MAAAALVQYLAEQPHKTGQTLFFLPSRLLVVVVVVEVRLVQVAQVVLEAGVVITEELGERELLDRDMLVVVVWAIQ